MVSRPLDRSTNPAFVPAWPVVDNPVLRVPQEPGDTNYVEHPDSARLLDFACAAYGLLLRALNQVFGRPKRKRAAHRAALLDLWFALMHVLARRRRHWRGYRSAADAAMPA